MWFPVTLLLAASTSASAGGVQPPPQMEERVMLEADVDVKMLSAGWTQRERAGANELITMTFALKQQNLQLLTKTVLEVSDPNNVRYGKHLIKDEVDALVEPSQQSMAAVNAYLRSHAVSDCESSGAKDLMRCTVAVATAESMLRVQFFRFEHSKANTTIIRAARHYSLPASVAVHLDFVAPVTKFPPARALGMAHKVERSKVSDRTNTPATLRELYNVGKVEGKVGTNNSMACTAFLQQYFRQKDLKKFYQKYYPVAEGRAVKVVGNDEGFPGIEASLDIQYISTMGGGVEAEFWTFAGSAPDNRQNEPFLDWIYMVGNTSDAQVPKIFSTSYGEAEYTVSMAYMGRIEFEFQKHAARGITLLFASGDSGVSDDDGECKGGRFAGQWPAGSPWVTGVGGTEGGGSGIAEQAWGGSSGGFSDRWPVPDFQKDAVATFLASGNLPDAVHYNASSRGFPDVSAQGTNFLVINGGMTQNVAGTSCACPTFSGILALLNDLRLQQGKSTLGWVNPFFYQNPDIFTDIVKGANEAGSGCGEKGFSAVTGWDPVTGLGTPDYSKMAKTVLLLP